MGTMESSTGTIGHSASMALRGLRLLLGTVAMESLSIAPAPPFFGQDHGLMGWGCDGPWNILSVQFARCLYCTS
jgi:hypothetical protein